MTIQTSASFLQSLLPPSWRAIQAHSLISTSDTRFTYILSPEGKRFSTVEAVNIYLKELIEERKKNQKIDYREMFKHKDTSIIDDEREKGVAKRKKKMSDRNPLRNILKRTLKKNYFKRKSMTKQLKKQRN